MFTREEIKAFIAKLINNITSIKFFVLMTTTYFFYIGKLSEGIWQETMLVVAGLRVATDVAAMFKKPTGEAPVEQAVNPEPPKV